MSLSRLIAMVCTAVALVSTAGVSPSSSSGTVPDPPKPVHCPGCWHPNVHTTWNWVLSRPVRPPYRDVSMYDVDGFETTKAGVADLHAAGKKVVCYLSAGTYENFRPDADQFPKALLGRKNGWPGERWLDIRELQQPDSVLRTIMDNRLDMCRAKNFDMVELDNVEGYRSRTGFPLTAADQLFFNATLANDARSRGMSVLQKNDLGQIPTLLPYFDGALDEQCNQYKECTTRQNGKFGLDQYVAAGKPVFQAEYRLTTGQFCPADNRNDFNGVRFDLMLNDKVFEPCRS